jgi:Flp pilus assembly protein TadG
MSRTMNRALRAWFHLRRSACDMVGDCRAIAATEFAVIVPIMLVMFFGTVEFSSAVAVDRKVTLLARTLSDLTSQSPPSGVSDSDLGNYRAAATGVMTPYSATPLKMTITELWVNSSLQARVQWSKGDAPRTAKTIVVVPTALAVADTYLILSEVSYLYTPTVGYVMAKAGVNLSDISYTRPRQNLCVVYPASTSGVTPACPKS